MTEPAPDGAHRLRPLIRAENRLEDALLAARDRVGDEALLRALAAAQVYLPAPAGKPAGAPIPFPLLDVGGAPFVPAFSSLAQLARFRPGGGPYLELEGRALAATWPDGHGLALNPGSELGATLTAEQVERLGEAPPQDGAELLIGEPTEEPLALLDTLRRFGESHPEVRAAYRALLVRRDTTTPEPVIGLELASQSDAAAVVQAAAQAAREAGVERLALLVLDRDGRADPVARFLLERTQPFFARS
ncbi:MAG: enhanced serine sensitivity protein SseB [Actinobacteria bacterium]|nr:enhanced serine sensitivity protein SseB [Actinomycetota bacterium]